MSITKKLNQKRFVLLFDLDDTLIPTTDFLLIAREKALDSMLEYGLYEVLLDASPTRKLSLSEARNMLMVLLKNIVSEKGSNYTAQFDDLLKSIASMYNFCFLKVSFTRLVSAGVLAYHRAKMTLSAMPDVPITLKTLKQEGYPMALVTDGIAVKQWEKILMARLDVFFSRYHVFISECEKMSKANDREKFFLHVAKHLNVEPAGCVMIGDKENVDIVPAKNVGMYAIRVDAKPNCPKKSKADVVVKEVGSLVAAVHKIERSIH